MTTSVPSAARSMRSAVPRTRMRRPSANSELDGRLGRVAAAECQLGREASPCSARGAPLAVGVEERVELGQQHAPVAVPQQPAAGDAARFGAPAARELPRRSRRRARSSRPSGQERVEDVVHHRAAIDRRELHDLFGPLDRLDVEHVLHEVRVRAARPRSRRVGETARSVSSGLTARSALAEARPGCRRNA